MRVRIRDHTNFVRTRTIHVAHSYRPIVLVVVTNILRDAVTYSMQQKDGHLRKRTKKKTACVEILGWSDQAVL